MQPTSWGTPTITSRSPPQTPRPPHHRPVTLPLLTLSQLGRGPAVDPVLHPHLPCLCPILRTTALNWRPEMVPKRWPHIPCNWTCIQRRFKAGDFRVPVLVERGVSTATCGTNTNLLPVNIVGWGDSFSLCTERIAFQSTHHIVVIQDRMNEVLFVTWGWEDPDDSAVATQVGSDDAQWPERRGLYQSKWGLCAGAVLAPEVPHRTTSPLLHCTCSEFCKPRPTQRNLDKRGWVRCFANTHREDRSEHLWISSMEEYTFIQKRFHPKTDSNTHVRPKLKGPRRARWGVEYTFIQHRRKMTLSSKFSSNYSCTPKHFIQKPFQTRTHPMTVPAKHTFVQNIVVGARKGWGPDPGNRTV